MDARWKLELPEAKLIGKRRFPNWHGPQGVGPANKTLIQNSKAGFGTLGVIVSDELSSHTYVHSAFPIASRGNAYSVQVLNVSESSFGLEACITAGLGGASIRSFEPRYALEPDLYSTGAQLKIALAGIAYHVEVPDSNETVIHPDIGEASGRDPMITDFAVSSKRSRA